MGASNQMKHLIMIYIGGLLGVTFNLFVWDWKNTKITLDKHGVPYWFISGWIILWPIGFAVMGFQYTKGWFR